MHGARERGQNGAVGGNKTFKVGCVKKHRGGGECGVFHPLPKNLESAACRVDVVVLDQGMARPVREGKRVSPTFVGPMM